MNARGAADGAGLCTRCGDFTDGASVIWCADCLAEARRVLGSVLGLVEQPAGDDGPAVTWGDGEE